MYICTQRLISPARAVRLSKSYGMKNSWNGRLKDFLSAFHAQSGLKEAHADKTRHRFSFLYACTCMFSWLPDPTASLLSQSCSSSLSMSEMGL